jgi:hypothetical protein
LLKGAVSRSDLLDCSSGSRELDLMLVLVDSDLFMSAADTHKSDHNAMSYLAVPEVPATLRMSMHARSFTSPSRHNAAFTVLLTLSQGLTMCVQAGVCVCMGEKSIAYALRMRKPA